MSKKINYAILTVLILAGGFIGYRYLNAGNEPSYNFVTAQRGNFVQEISATGKVSPSAKIDLRFKNPGKIEAIGVKAGDKIKAGQMLAAEDSGVLDASLRQARAGIDLAEAKLKQLVAGSSPEDIRLNETAVANAEIAVSNNEKSLSDAEANLESVKSKSQADLDQAYSGALAAADKSVSVAASSLFTLTNIQLAHFNSSDQNGANVADAKALAVLALLGGQNGGRISNDTISQLKGGAKGAVLAAEANVTNDNIDSALLMTRDALQKVQAALDAVPVISDITTTESTNLSTEKANINAEIISIDAKEKAIKVQKAANNSSIVAAQEAVDNSQSLLKVAQGNLRTAQDQLALKKAPPRSADIDLAKAQISQSKASAAGIEEQIKEMTLSAPVDGTITDTNGNPGETVSPDAIVVSLMPSGNLEIDVDISESNIVGAKVGQDVRITLDAFPDSVSWSGKILSIDPAETLIGGSVYYKTKVVFGQEDDRIRSGMTANIWINADSRENVISVPISAVREKNNKKYVEVLKGKNAIEKEVQTGPSGKDGVIEIVSGLNEGDKVIISSNKN